MKQIVYVASPESQQIHVWQLMTPARWRCCKPLTCRARCSR